MNWLLVDSSYLARRAWHTVGHLSYEGVSTGVAFGFMRELDEYRGLHQIDRVVLAFDFPGTGIRGQMFPGYKQSRLAKKMDQIKQEREADFRAQIRRLERHILPALGYRNVLSEKGYEADDIIAAVADDMLASDFAVILTADTDMYQCVRSNVSWYSPLTKKTMTSKLFHQQYGLDPVMWASVKALAGCDTDDVPGIRGVGEKTAAKWFNGTLKTTTKAYQAINDNLDVHDRNMPLVRLPLPGLELPDLRPDELTDDRRSEVFRSLGFRYGRKRKKKLTGFGLRG